MNTECLVVMPVYNEAGCIESVCREWLAEIAPRGFALLVVNDGSTDATGALLERLAAAEPSLRVAHKTNGGHGTAVLAGYREAVGSRCEWVFQVDSDGQFRAADFSHLWERRSQSDFLLGCRTGRKDPLYRRALSCAHGRLLRAVFGTSAHDPNVPYRLMRRHVLAALLPHLPERVFAPNVFLTALACRGGYPPLNIPVGHFERAAGHSSIPVKKMARLCRLCLAEMIRFRRREFARYLLTLPAATPPLVQSAAAGGARPGR